MPGAKACQVPRRAKCQGVFCEVGEEEQQAVRELVNISPTRSDDSVSTVPHQSLDSASDRSLAESGARHAVREKKVGHSAASV